MTFRERLKTAFRDSIDECLEFREERGDRTHTETGRGTPRGTAKELE